MAERISPTQELTLGLALIPVDVCFGGITMGIATNPNAPLPLRLAMLVPAIAPIIVSIHGGVRTFRENRAQNKMSK